MRIAVICEGTTPHDRRFLELFRDAGHQVGRVLLLPGGAGESGEPPAGVADLLRLPRGHGPLRERILAARSDLSGCLRAFGAEVVFAGPLDTCAYAAALADAAPVVAVCWAFDLLWRARRDPAAREACALALRHAHAALVDSRFLAEELRVLGFAAGKPVARAPFGVDLESFEPSAALTARALGLRTALGLGPAQVLVCCNRGHAPLYRPLDVLEAFGRAAARRPELFLHLAGRGPLSGELAQRARELGVAERIHFAGWVPEADMPAVLAAADVYVSAAEVDGSSVSLMQAMAAGLPILAADIPGNREWVAGRACGELVTVGDVDGLAGALERMAALPAARRRELGARGRAHALLHADWRESARTILDRVEKTAAAPA